MAAGRITPQKGTHGCTVLEEIEMPNVEKFERSHGGRRARTLLMNARSAYTLKTLYNVVRANALASTTKLIGGIPYASRELMDPDFWTCLCLPEKGAAGHCMSWLVKAKDVPFIPHRSQKRGGSRKYQLSPEHVLALIEANRGK